MKALARNKLASHAAYPKILNKYNEILQQQGRVNNKKFYEEYILPEIPSYHLQSWYNHLKKFKAEAGLIVAEVQAIGAPMQSADEKTPAVQKVTRTLATITDATNKGIALALNIGADRLKDIMENPQLMTSKEAADLLFKAMKAQDSRIHAVGKIREENREQEKFERAFSGAAYE